MPNGATVGTTKAKGLADVKFCIACHMAVGAETDSMLFLPAEFRKLGIPRRRSRIDKGRPHGAGPFLLRPGFLRLETVIDFARGY